MAIYCWAPGCNHNNVREQCSFFRFPKDMKKYRKWLALLRRDDEPNPDARICSCHFKDGKKENGPELYDHNKEKLFGDHYLSPEKKKMRRQISSEENVAIVSEELQPSISSMEASSVQVPGCSATISIKTAQTIGASVMLQAENTLLQAEIERKEEIMETLRLHMSYENISQSDKLVLEYTGLPTGTIFESLYSLIEKVEIQYYLKWNIQKIERINQLLLTLMKLRQNFSHIDLAFRFQVSEATVTNIVTTFIHVLYEALYINLMIDIPSRAKNRSCLRNCYSSFTNCRIIIDCTEIFCSVPRHSMEKQRLTYSTYKHRNTLKGLVGAAPNGVITFLSDLYPGAPSDRNIVNHCGILDHLQAGDLVLADKGFLIKELLPPGVSLNIPPFLTTPQFTPAQIQQTKSIAKARIHVERSIRRMKSFRILSMIPEKLFPYCSIIFKTIGALTNLQYPLIKEVSEFYVDRKESDT